MLKGAPHADEGDAPTLLGALVPEHVAGHHSAKVLEVPHGSSWDPRRRDPPPKKKGLLFVPLVIFQTTNAVPLCGPVSTRKSHEHSSPGAALSASLRFF